MDKEMEVSKELLEQLIQEKKIEQLRELFEEHNIVDMSELVSELTLQEALFLFKTLKKDITAEVFSYLIPEKQEKLISAFTAPQIKEMLNNLYSDDIVDFIGEMPANVVNRVLEAASPSMRKEINELLSYAENSAGSIMTTDFVVLKANDTSQEAIDKVKKQGHLADTIQYCYVVDNKRKLIGYIGLRDLILMHEDLLIKDVMETDLIVVNAHEDQESVAKLASRYDLTAIAVIADDERLLGIITIDDIIDVMQDEVTEDIQKMAAVVPLENTYLQTSIMDLVKSRIGWLIFLMLSATITGIVISQFESALHKQVILVSFIPLIMGTAGNAGSQSCIMIIRGISLNEIEAKDFFKVIRKELLVALLCGGVLLVVNVIRICLLSMQVANIFTISIVVSIAMFFSLVFAKVTGGVLPLVATVFKSDPAVMASPLITTIVDVVALFIYFLIAKMMLGI